MDPDTFTVVSFSGTESLSRPYRFEILLVSDRTDIEPSDVLKQAAMFTIHRDEEADVDFNGILMQFEESREYNDYFFYRAVLTPKLWWLSLTHHNQVFLNKTVPEIMEAALKDGGLAPGIDFSFSLMNTYPPFEYICQYDETHFDFVSRWAQREGIYYFFEQTPAGEKIVFTDSRMRHSDFSAGKDLYYDPASGMAALHTREVIHDFVCRHSMLPGKIHLKDYNYLKPSMSVEGMADVDPEGRGENYIYGVWFDDPVEGNRLAAIRAEALMCRKTEFHGRSSVPFMMPGYTFDLNDHYKPVYNRKYLVTDVSHEGHQTGYLIAGLGPALTRREQDMFYANTFTAIYSDRQFRAPHETPMPRISGTINAKIDAAGSGRYAEIDEHGRYKVILPFDLSGRFNGKASAWFRMMQPYAGENQGMHFPLHKGTEVLLTFIDGNPDRPVIAGAVPNPETGSPVRDRNQTQSIITTGKNNPHPSVGAAAKGAMTASGKWKTTPTDNYIEFEDQQGAERIRLHSDHDLWFEAQNRYADYRIGVPDASEGRPAHVADLIDKMYRYDGSDFAPTGMTLYSDQAPYAKSTGGGDVTTVNFASLGTNKEKWQYLVDKGQVSVIKGDTFKTQEGNIYDFGGYWSYNLGNSYTETHMNQKAALNQARPMDLLDRGGPGWTRVDWSKALASDVTASGCPEESDIRIGENSQWNNSGGSTQVLVGKTFANTYSYTEGDSISVTRGRSLSIGLGGPNAEIKYSVDNGKRYMRAWTWGHGYDSKEKNWDELGRLLLDKTYIDGVLNESTWNYYAKKSAPGDLPRLTKKFEDETSGITSVHTYCRDTDNLLSYNSTHQGFNSVHSFDFNWANTAKASFEFAAAAAFSFSLAAKLDLSISAAANAKIGIGAAFDLEMYWNPAGKVILKNGAFEYHGINSRLDKEAELKAHNQSLVLQNLTMRVRQANLRLGNTNAKLNRYTVDLGMGTVLKM